jgi:archaellum biogenesis protein FlaJ (TadC family)
MIIIMMKNIITNHKEKRLIEIYEILEISCVISFIIITIMLFIEELTGFLITSKYAIIALIILALLGLIFNVFKRNCINK